MTYPEQGRGEMSVEDLTPSYVFNVVRQVQQEELLTPQQISTMRLAIGNVTSAETIVAFKKGLAEHQELLLLADPSLLDPSTEGNEKSLIADSRVFNWLFTEHSDIRDLADVVARTEDDLDKKAMKHKLVLSVWQAFFTDYFSIKAARDKAMANIEANDLEAA